MNDQISIMYYLLFIKGWKRDDLERNFHKSIAGKSC